MPPLTPAIWITLHWNELWHFFNKTVKTFWQPIRHFAAKKIIWIKAHTEWAWQSFFVAYGSILMAGTNSVWVWGEERNGRWSFSRKRYSSRDGLIDFQGYFSNLFFRYKGPRLCECVYVSVRERASQCFSSNFLKFGLLRIVHIRFPADLLETRDCERGRRWH